MVGTDAGGDAACWLDRVCDECGAFVDDGDQHVCPRRHAAASTDADTDQ